MRQSGPSTLAGLALAAAFLLGTPTGASAWGVRGDTREPASATTTVAAPADKPSATPEAAGAGTASATAIVAGATAGAGASPGAPAAPALTERVLSAIGGAVAGDAAEATKAEPPQMYKLNFQNQDMKKILEWLMNEKKKPVMGHNVSGQFTLMNPREVTYDEAYRLIEEVLNAQGYTIVEDDLMIWVMKIEEAKVRIPETIVGLENVPAGFQTYRVLVPLKYASASQIRDKLTPLAGTAEFLVDERSETLIIVSTGNNLRRLEGVLKHLDVPSEDSSAERDVIQLQHIEAREVDSRIRDIFGDGLPRPIAHGERKIPLKINSAPNNYLIISGHPLDVSAVKEFVARIDMPQAGAKQFFTLEIRDAEAARIANTLQQIVRGRRDLPTPPVIVSDDWTNTLIVSGEAKDASWLFEIARRMDVPKILEEETEIIPVEHMDVSMMSEYIKNIVDDRPRLRYEYSSRWGSERSYDTNRSSNTRWFEDYTTNSLVVTGRAEEIRRIRYLVEKLDVSVDQETEGAQIHYLERADATEVADKLNELFGQIMGTSFSGDVWGRGVGMWGEFSGPARGRTARPSEEIKAIPMASINAVAVFARTAKAHAEAAAMIDRLDQETPELGSTLVVPLQNANASEMAAMIDSLFTQGGQDRDLFWFLSGGAESERLISGLIGKIRIKPEPRTNSLIVITSKQNHNAIVRLIEDLDRATAQVMVEVLVLGVVLDDRFDLGIEWGSLDSSGDPGSFSLNSTALGTPGQGVTGNITDNSGYGSNFTDAFSNWQWAVLSRAQFDVALHFLDKKADSQIISRPVLMTWDNKSARFVNGQKVPLVTQIREAADGRPLPQFEYTDVGLILDVTPHINHQNKVDLKLNLKLDELTNLEVLGAPIFNTRNITTNVSVQDGNTVVVAGIIQDSYSQINTKVPFLGDVPILGLPFRRKRDVKAKTELMAFLTPHVVRTGEDLERFLKEHRKQTGLDDRENEIRPNLFEGYPGGHIEERHSPLLDILAPPEAPGRQSEPLIPGRMPEADPEEPDDGETAPDSSEAPGDDQDAEPEIESGEEPDPAPPETGASRSVRVGRAFNRR